MCLFTAVKCSLDDWGMTQTRNPIFTFEPWNGISPILICFWPDSMTLVWVTVLFRLFYCSFYNCKRLVFLFWCWSYIYIHIFFLVLFEKAEKIKTSGSQISLHCGFGLICAVGPDFWSRSPRGQIQQIYGRTSSHMKSPFLLILFLCVCVCVCVCVNCALQSVKGLYWNQISLFSFDVSLAKVFWL